MLRSIDQDRFPALRFNKEKLTSLTNVSRVIVVGSSATGKSTIERLVRKAVQKNHGHNLCVPRRVVTRAARADDTDMRCVSPDEFQELAQGESLGLWGKKYMEDGREEWYGFEKPTGSSLPIYFANNAVVKNPELVQPRDDQGSLVISVYAPQHVRIERLRRRSPQFFSDTALLSELRFRLSPEEDSEKLSERAHIVVYNFNEYEHRSAADLAAFLCELC